MLSLFYPYNTHTARTHTEQQHSSYGWIKMTALIPCATQDKDAYDVVLTCLFPAAVVYLEVQFSVQFSSTIPRTLCNSVADALAQ